MVEPIQKDPIELIRLAKAGDSKAFGLIYDMYFTPVYRYIYFRVKARQEAEDLTQAVFMNAFQALPRYEMRGKSPLAYFYTSARNTVINYWRKKKELSLEAEEERIGKMFASGSSPEEEFERNRKSEVLKKALSGLTEDQQEVIVMKFLGDLKTKEIAQVTGKSEEAIRQLQSRGLKALRKIIKNQ